MIGLVKFVGIDVKIVIPNRRNALQYMPYSGWIRHDGGFGWASIRILHDATDLGGTLNHFVPLVRVDAAVPEEHACWAKEWCMAKSQNLDFEICHTCLLPYHADCIWENQCGCNADEKIIKR